MNRQNRPENQVPARMIGQSSQDHADIVIVGNGIAGLTAAVEARRLAPSMRIVIFTEQSHPTINTPALKQFAIGKLAREQLLAYPVGTEREQQILVIHARVEAINAQGKCVFLKGGRSFGYGSLLIATGSVATALPASLPGQDFDGVLTLHRLQDYLDLRRHLNEVDEAVVIGSGAHAIETVASLLYLGIQVHWLIRNKTVLSRTLDQPASEMVLEHFEEAGAKVYTETEVVGIIGRVGTVAGVITNQQQMISCQLVLVCTGTAPAITLAEHCSIPLLTNRGILVDHQLRTSVPDIYAAGDVAALKNPLTGAYETRAQWYAAVLQGRTAAVMMAGQLVTELRPFGVSWHATHLGKLALLTVADPLNWTEWTTTLTDSRKGGYRRLSIIGDRLVGYLSLGPTQPDGLAIKRLIDEGCPIHTVKDALLKGTFDARKYFSERSFHEIRTIVTAGRVPVSKTIYQPVYPLPITDPLSKSYVPHTTDPLTPAPVGHSFRTIQQSGRIPVPMYATGDEQVNNQQETGDFLHARFSGMPKTTTEIRLVLSPSPKLGLPSRRLSSKPTRRGQFLPEKGY